MPKLLSVLLVLFAVASSTATDTQYMRREDKKAVSAEPSAKMTQKSGSEPEGRFLTAGIASSGAVTKLAEQQEAEARVASSLITYKRNYAEAQALLQRAQKTDMYDEDGFEMEQVTLKDRLKDMDDAKARESVDLLAIQKDEEERSTAHQKMLSEGGMSAQLLQSKEQDDAKRGRVATYSGRNAVVTGFWAKDRPFEERIDPDNMKIYTFKTYKHRYPFVHSWEVEVLWKKLPLAPKKIHKVRHAQSPGQTETGVLLEGGVALVDENQRELVWSKDYNGYYHMGREVPTENEIFSVAHPVEAEMEKFSKKEAEKEELYGLYHDNSDQLQEVKRKMASTKMVDREDAARQLETMLVEMQATLNLQPSRSGKAFISVRGAEGDLCSFNADIAKVTGMAMKHRIEKATGIPWEAQMLFIQGKELEDSNLLNERVGAGRGAWIDLQQRGWEVTKAALIKRGKLAQPAAPPQRTETVLEETEVNTPAAAKFHEGRHKSSHKKVNRYLSRLLAHMKKTSRQRSSHKAGGFVADAKAQQPSEVREFSTDMVAEKVAAGADQIADYNDNEHGMTDDSDDDAKKDQLMDERDKEKATEDVYQVEAQKTAEEYARKFERTAEQNAEAANVMKTLDNSPVQKAIVTRQVVYVRGEDGGWLVEKEEVATPEHPISNKTPFDNGVDEGVPVQERLSDANGEVASYDQQSTKDTSIPDELLEGPTHQRFDKKEFLKEQKHALSEEMKWRNQEKLNGDRAAQKRITSTLPPRTALGPGASTSGPPMAKAAEVFLQVESFSAPAAATPAAASLADSKKMRDDALQEATRARTLFVLEKRSKATLDIENANVERIDKARQWREAANPIEKYDGSVDWMSMSEVSKRRTQQDKAYDGLQAVSSGFWAEDRPDERRVDITDHKIYTWRQYRLKHAFRHSWEVEDMWKEMPTQQRVQKLGKLAFVQRFR